MEITIGKTAGFCFGVKRAVEGSLNEIKNEKEKKIYCLGELVHNSQVIEKLKEHNIEIIEDINEIKEKNAKVIIRAHGIKNEIYEIAKNKNIEIIDFTCPFVLKIHDIAKEYSEKEFYIFVIGSEKHPETQGTVSYCGNRFSVIETEEDVQNAMEEFNKSKLNNLLVIVQTTFSEKKFAIIEEKIKKSINKNINLVIKNTICSATNQRQKETDELSKKVDYMIIIGGSNSSNTKKLYEVSKSNCKDTILIETAEELDIKKIKETYKVGIMAGASTPDFSIKEVVNKLLKNKE
ncbi:MAG: 4-hydroxy-3-methylbut-2-enyl diphosphate reductase [Clostridia bacterium]|nr:4-hydroxy-3-methylbut-2-enyl diphosphate reductase [Clostridia bacterium]